MRLVLDELYSRVIAERLREFGHDAIAVTERSDLAGRSDAELFSMMAAEHRAIVTENWGDFHRLLQEADATGMTHYGVLFTSRERLPRGKRTIGLFVRVLDDFLKRHPAEGALLNGYRWLPDGLP